MREYVDRLSTTLIGQYKLYVETFMVDLWSDLGLIEFRVGFSLRVDHKLRSFAVKIDAAEAVNDVERRAVIAAIFLEIEDHIDEAIAATLLELN
ncbi:hypothetical protein JP75_20815 [Devosia riboflavina]|uniref:Uncharacterized protein n=1 Tax=Devosia riboflavina TaxID=46914 RepID=A0A087LY10_9HYPH|nr:hypothetical protein [Devosia riboflavina]KFL29513.1 hypothetical protein JP75_20815 [Devosia riboflavina]